MLYKQATQPKMSFSKFKFAPPCGETTVYFREKNFNLIKNLKGNRQMQYAKQQIFLSQIQHLNIFARVNKKKWALLAALCKFQYVIINHLHKKKKLRKVYEHSTKSITLADCIQTL